MMQCDLGFSCTPFFFPILRCFGGGREKSCELSIPLVLLFLHMRSSVMFPVGLLVSSFLMGRMAGAHLLFWIPR